jgi:hypothetical protein
MSFKEKFDFCLISNPYNGNGKSIIFITSRGLDYIDETITSDDQYKKVKSFMANLNFSEIEFCSFESNTNISNIEDDLITQIENRGLRYSKSLEIKISKEIQEIHKNKIEKTVAIQPIFSTGQPFLGNSIPFDPPAFKVPDMGEKMSLYFYLFLECHFVNDDDCVILLNGEFNTNENNHFRNFLKISKADFIRIPSDDPSVLVLQSVKKYSDFLSEVNILHNGKFKIIKPFTTEIGQKGYKTKEYQYSFVEIKKSINPDHHIVIQVSLNTFFNQMVERSKQIKKELITTEKRTISIEFIKSEISHIKNKLEHKMIDFAELDEYERASYFKKNITMLDDKLKLINNINEENMLVGDFMKIFTLN